MKCWTRVIGPNGEILPERSAKEAEHPILTAGELAKILLKTPDKPVYLRWVETVTYSSWTSGDETVLVPLELTAVFSDKNEPKVILAGDICER